ncbi:MAG TPA: 30S ribosomal protein S17 [Candidatus Nanoarchaeia archaeon]|nr:30S ribosomal protein S17 [Candidatus Nanoarchaeia archaeon]
MKTELLGAKSPEKECTDKKCPFHGEITVKEESFTGKVVKKDINRSATIEWEKSSYVPKYERYEVRRRRLRVHNPACINAQLGDIVIAAKTRPLSKTKHHVIIQKTGSVVEVQAVDVAAEKKTKLKKIPTTGEDA